jgi:hypothetical protein
MTSGGSSSSTDGDPMDIPMKLPRTAERTPPTERTAVDRALRVMPPQFIASALVEICLDVFYVTRSALTGDRVAVPGAVARTVLMGVLGWLAIRRTSRLSRWLFVGVQFATAGAALMFAFFTFPGGALAFEPVPFALFVAYLLLGVAASIGSAEPKT